MDYYVEARQGHGILFYLMLLVLALLAFMALCPPGDNTSALFSLEHARERHGQDADDVYNCYKDNGPLMTFWNMVTGRCAHVVKPDSNYGLVIEGPDGGVVTAFKVGESLERLFRYLRNRGYAR